MKEDGHEKDTEDIWVAIKLDGSKINIDVSISLFKLHVFYLFTGYFYNKNVPFSYININYNQLSVSI